jgi:hypothetical protein
MTLSFDPALLMPGSGAAAGLGDCSRPSSHCATASLAAARAVGLASYAASTASILIPSTASCRNFLFLFYFYLFYFLFLFLFFYFFIYFIFIFIIKKLLQPAWP